MQTASSSLRIGAVAGLAGIGVETVRFYEKRGLIDTPPRESSGYRAYPADVVDRLRFIRRTKDLGFSLREIRELLQLRRASDVRCDEVCDRVSGKIEEIDRRIREMKRIRRALQKMHDSCAGGVLMDECGILRVLDRDL